ncbi:MAG: hypothetical protein IPK82_34630 [Polyangiaceae bacterium]|nr:hypothetical protein [Polyangiaceae bacterium]
MTTPSRLRLGQLLVDAKLITPEALEDVLAAQKTDGRRLGQLLVERGHISEVQLTQILSHQLSVPWVSLHRIEFSRKLLNLVPRSLAEQYGVLPIYVRRIRNHGDTLYIATDDPSNDEVLRACAAYAGLPVRPMIAPPSDIRSAIRAYYSPESNDETPAPDGGARAPMNRAAERGEVSAAAPANPTAEPLATETSPASAADNASAAAAQSTLPEGTAPESGPPASPIAYTSAGAASEIHVSLSEPSAAEAVNSDRQAALPQPSPAAGARPAHTHAQTLRSAVFVEDVTASNVADEAPAIVRDSRPMSEPPPSIEVHQEEDLAAVLAQHRQRRTTPLPGERPAQIPAPRGKAPKMMSLTFLDGTQISLPTPKSKAAPEAVAEGSGAPSPLTARDLVDALRAVAAGAEPGEVLGEDVRWETMFAALLSVLLKKQLIADWEFVEELNRLKRR